MQHIPVLQKEVLEGLALKEGDRVLDGTLGLGGHSKLICDQIGKTGILVGLDQDPKALETATKNLKGCEAKLLLRQGNFRNLDQILEEEKVEHMDAMLLDLGVGSHQLETSGRGFSFQRNEPLLMTYGERPEELTAHSIVNTWDEENIEAIIANYGEEQYSRRIAKGIVAAREEKVR